jgi:hypothetical protein
MDTKMAVARTMMTTAPFKRWPLHVRIFTEEAWAIWNTFDGIEPVVAGPKGRKKKKEPRTFEPLQELTEVTLDLGGVDGKTGRRGEEVKGVTKIDGPIDVEDTEFKEAVWGKWKRFKISSGSVGNCAICQGEVEDLDVSLFAWSYDWESKLTNSSTFVGCFNGSFLPDSKALRPGN